MVAKVANLPQGGGLPMPVVDCVKRTRSLPCAGNRPVASAVTRPTARPRHDRIVSTVSLIALLMLLCCNRFAEADEVTLKNGITLSGAVLQVAGLTPAGAKIATSGPVPSYSFWVIDDGVRRYFVHRRNVAKNEEVANLGANVSFKLKHEKSSRTSGFPSVGGFGSVQPFDEYGRRTVTLSTQKGMVPIIQGIKLMRPDYTDLESLTHQWDYSIDTKALPPEVVQSVIAKSSNRDDPAERKAAALFYVQAQMFNEAREEVRQLAERFPDMKDWCEEYQQQISEYIARKAINEIERRRDAGQHQLAMQYARQFPADQVSAEIRQKVADLMEQYGLALQNRDRILLQLDMLQSQIPQAQFERLRSLRVTLQEELNYERMSRLEPFLRAEDDDSLTAAQKLALAYSGWLLGNDGAVLDLDEAIRLWDARFQVLEYLRNETDPLRDSEILEHLGAIEGVGPERLSRMLKHLPLPLETPAVAAGEMRDVDLPAGTGTEPLRYSLMLPPEYHPAHAYPLLVVLRGDRSTYANELRWWAGDATRPGWAQRRGYIVIAPHYLAADASSYEPDSAQQAAILQSINHVRKCCHVDSDRIFLAGHGLGGDACVDVGMSNPGVFAGVIPINGIASASARVCAENDPLLHWYFIGGERDRNTLEKNAPTLSEMMKHGQDVLYCEYKSRGYESYSEELDRLFDWMQPLRRSGIRDAARWETNSVRKSTNRFYWMQAKQIPDRATDRPARYEGIITPGSQTYKTQTIYISHPGKATTIWISPELFDFNNRCQVRVNLKHVLNDYIKPSMEAMLSDVRERGDRQRLYWARLEL